MVSLHSRARPPDNVRKIRRSSPPSLSLGAHRKAFTSSHDFFREGLTTMDGTSTTFGSMFGSDLFHSMFDGIRLGRRNRYDLSHAPLFDEPFGRTSSIIPETSSNVRIIPINVEHGPRQEPNKSKSFGVSSRETLPSRIESSLTDTREKENWNRHNNISAIRTRLGSENKADGSSYTSLTKNEGFITIDDDDDDNVKCIEIKDVPVDPRPQAAKAISRSQKPITVEYLNSLLKTSSASQKTNVNNNSNDSTGSNATRSSAVAGSLLGINSDLQGDDSDLDFLSTKLSDYTSPVLSREARVSGACAGECDMSVVDEEKEVNPTPSYPVYVGLKERLTKENRQIDYIKGDGNCFFRALSKQLYGSERYHKAVRNLITDIVATNKTKFAQFVDGENVQKHVERMSENHSWATTCEIYAAATMLQRDIYMLTPDHLNEKYNWLLFKPLFKTAQKDGDGTRHPCYITFCNTNGNHYDRIIPDHGGCNCFLPAPELEGFSSTMDLTE